MPGTPAVNPLETSAPKDIWTAPGALLIASAMPMSHAIKLAVARYIEKDRRELEPDSVRAGAWPNDLPCPVPYPIR